MTERDIFTEALHRTNAAERAAFLDRVCGSNAALRRRVESLLARHAECHLLLDRCATDLFDALTETEEDRPEAASICATTSDELAALLDPPQRRGALGRLGHYEVLDILGQGGFGIVVKAFDDHLQRVVAIKLLAPSLAVTSPPRKRFLREARAAARVKHEHVVQVYGVEEQPLPYLVMEFVDGVTLQEKLKSHGPFEAAEVIRLGSQIAQGLAAAHDKGLVHRDVKPANILLEGDIELRAKLTDFGLARAMDDASQTHSGWVAGTPMYMSPEEALGGAVDHRSDLFSLGSVLYAMVTGRPPFRAGSTLAVLKRVAEGKPRPIRQIIPEVPESLCSVIMRLLKKNPDERFRTASEVAEALVRAGTNPVLARKQVPAWIVTLLALSLTTASACLVLLFVFSFPNRSEMAPTSTSAMRPVRAEEAPAKTDGIAASVPPVPSNESSSVSFVTATQEVAESAGEFTVEVQLSAPQSRYVIVPIEVTGGTANGRFDSPDPADFVLHSFTIEIPAGAVTGKLSLATIHDDRIEGNETLILTMSPPVNATRGAITVHTVTLVESLPADR